MNIEEVRQACLAMHGAVDEGSPFAELGHPDIAYKIGGKIFAYLCVPDAPSCRRAESASLLVLKADPDAAVELRDRYPGVVEPAWHWNKKHWNQVRYDSLPKPIVDGMIADSFNLVFNKLPKKVKELL